ncbi:MAG: C39 family peptidase [Coprobacillaceae bacterium]
MKLIKGLLITLLIFSNVPIDIIQAEELNDSNIDENMVDEEVDNEEPAPIEEEPVIEEQEESITAQSDVIEEIKVNYSTHVSDIGWMSYQENGATSGNTTGKFQIEAIKMKISDSNYSGNINYSLHCEDIGWQSSVNADTMAGTVGKGLRAEAIKISLDGELATYYDVYYRVYIYGKGWLDWTSNGSEAGSSGCSTQMQGIQIKVLCKDDTSISVGNNAFIKQLNISSQAHIQDIGWQGVQNNSSGVTGRGLRMEALKLTLPEELRTLGSIQYKVHIQDIGWQGWKSDGQLAGTTGRSLRIEAIQIQLTGELSNMYDIYYRTHVQEIGWLNWTSNSALSGSEGISLRMEAIEIKLVSKGMTPPTSTGTKPFVQKVELNVPYINQYAYGAPMGCEGAALLQSLQGKGYATNVGYKTFLNNMPYATDNNPYNGFVGSPYTVSNQNIYQSIFPTALAPYGNRYGTSINTTGYTANQLVDELYAGNTSVVYVTYNFQNPKYNNYFFGQAVDNMHVMTLTGYNPATDQFRVMDPAGLGSYWVNGASFRQALNASGRKSIVVK